MARGTYKVHGFTRKGGVKVAAHSRSKPTLSKGEKGRRAGRARKTLIPAAIKATGRKGFRATAAALARKPGVTSPERLAGWLKGQAKKSGQLSSAHPYVGRKGYKKYPKAAARMSPSKYKAYLRAKRK